MPSDKTVIGLQNDPGDVIEAGPDSARRTFVAVDAVEQALATILADYAVTTRTAQPRRVQPGEVISRLRMETG